MGEFKILKFEGNEKQKPLKVLYFMLNQLNQTELNMKFLLLINSEKQLIDGWKEVLRFRMIYSRWNFQVKVLMPHGRKKNEFKKLSSSNQDNLSRFPFGIRRVNDLLLLRIPSQFLYVYTVYRLFHINTLFACERNITANNWLCVRLCFTRQSAWRHSQKIPKQ